MIVLKCLIAIITFLIIPIFLGLVVLKFSENEKNNVIFAFIIGYIIEFAICEITAITLIFMERSYNTLLCIYCAIIIILAIISFILNFKNLKEIIKINLKKIKKLPKLLSLLCILIIGFQIYQYVFYTHVDDDDAFYVGTATTSIQTNSLYKYSSTTGAEDGEQHLMRYRLGPFPLYLAIISSVINIHPAIVAHVVFPIIFVPLVYCIYYLLGNYIFKENKKFTLLFIILISVLQIWGNYSVRTTEAFFLFRIWQGKALLAAMILPLIWLIFFKANDDNFNFITCFLLFLTILAGNLLTTMGIGIPPITLMALVLAYEISKINFKNLKDNNYLLSIKNIFKVLICCIPSIICGLMYILY